MTLVYCLNDKNKRYNSELRTLANELDDCKHHISTKTKKITPDIMLCDQR